MRRMISKFSQSGCVTQTGSFTVPQGGNILLSATPGSGYIFDHWNVNGQTQSGNPLQLTDLTSNTTVAAVFTQQGGGRTAPVTITVVDPKGAPVANAGVAVDGVSFGITDPAGNVTGTLTVGSHTVSVTLAGTSEGRLQITVTAAGGSFTFTLPSATTFKTIFLIGGALVVLYYLSKRKKTKAAPPVTAKEVS